MSLGHRIFTFDQNEQNDCFKSQFGNTFYEPSFIMQGYAIVHYNALIMLYNYTHKYT